MRKKVDLSGLDPDLEADSEKLHRLARIGVGAIPVVGGPLVEIFNSVLESPLSKRRTETMIQLGEVINELIEQGVVTEAGLQDNDAFISTVAEVCAISLRNHEAEKLEALRNAVRNSALPSCPSDDYRQIFLNFVDVCTVTHIRLLHLFLDPELWIARDGRQFPSSWSMGGIDQVIEFALPELKGQDAIYKIIWKDLYQRGLINTDSLGTTMSAHGMKSSRTTPVGSALIKFLS
ncbi:hypothetical protein KW841_18055 [Pseudomonas sp. PDM28]|uniref:hypothetical protein n=1 Tax=Pseudomonas sp. PDM28 TaxID=2854770 RepID=UPI001C47A03C|nr:hypothetical protein [Pseudomonas sp. PDM28]MBV7554256.1 hypothetical protein [Pseudomonas sp. PDM28]